MKATINQAPSKNPVEASLARILADYDDFEKCAKDWLLTQVRSLDPYQFEHLVVTLLLAMKYGVRGTVTKKSGDAGIDGIIYEDKLGFTEILVQAKQWTNTVGRPDAQAFVGAIQSRQATKGVLLTTSQFSKEAREYVITLPIRVVLIDGWQLVDLMFQHNVGVQELGSIPLKKPDPQYFENLMKPLT
jgi:restriction system protein